MPGLSHRGPKVFVGASDSVDCTPVDMSGVRRRCRGAAILIYAQGDGTDRDNRARADSRDLLVSHVISPFF